MYDISKKMLIIILYHIFKLFPIKRNVIVFESSVGRSFSGNPRAIYEEMISNGMDKVYKIVWVLNVTNNEIPGNCRKVKRESLLYAYYLAVAKYWVFDGRHPRYFYKRRGTIYLQTWHGTPLKKIGLDLERVFMNQRDTLENYKKAFLKNVRQWDILLSQNHYSTQIFRKAFGFDKVIAEIGYPRNDRLLNSNPVTERERLKAARGWKNKRVILYAPTWRDDKHISNNVYDFELKLDLRKFIKTFDDNVILVIRTHYLNTTPQYSDFGGRIVVSCENDDLRDLMLMSDLLITDYSSIMFDFSLLKRPMIFFVYDLEFYRDCLRGFYFDLSVEAPGPLVVDNESLLKEIQRILSDPDEYWGHFGERYNSFRSKFNHADDGKASQKAIELLLSHSNG